MQSFITLSVTSAEEAGRDKEPGILSWHQLRLGFTTKGANYTITYCISCHQHFQCTLCRV